MCGHAIAPIAYRYNVKDLTIGGRGPECEVCLTVACLWLTKGIWRGFGKRPPGPDATWGLWLAIPERHLPRRFRVKLRPDQA